MTDKKKLLSLIQSSTSQTGDELTQISKDLDVEFNTAERRRKRYTDDAREKLEELNGDE